MKWIFFLLLFSFHPFLFSQNNIPAQTYYQLIRNEQQNIGRELYYFNNRVTELNLKLLTYQIKKSIAVIDSTPAYNHEEDYKKATLHLLNYFLSVSQHQYKTLLDYVEDPNMEDKAFKSKKQALLKDISIKEKPYDIAFNDAQDAYLRKYSIKPE
jgi:hypothetical protein